MFIKIHCIDYATERETIEFCSFRGIRYDRRTNSAVLSTEHNNHDYVFPLSDSHYEAIVQEIDKAIKAGAKMITLENGKVFRCKKGQLHRDSMQDKIMVVF